MNIRCSMFDVRCSMFDVQCSMFARQHFTFHGLLLAISLFVSLAPLSAKASDSGRPNPILRSPKDEANRGPKSAATAGLTAPRVKLAPSDLENQLNTLREQVRQLQSDKEGSALKLKEEHANQTELGARVNKLQAEKTELETKVKEAQVEKARGEAAANQLQADKTALESKLQETTAAQSAAIAKVESKIQSLEEENDRLRATLNQALSNLAAAVEAAKSVKQTPPTSAKTNRPSPNALFREGGQAYHAGDYASAATALIESATRHPSSGTLQNLGLAEWQRGIAGPAILAWEQSLFLDPFNKETRMNLRFARKTAQLEAPDLAWYEVELVGMDCYRQLLAYDRNRPTPRRPAPAQSRVAPGRRRLEPDVVSAHPPGISRCAHALATGLCAPKRHPAAPYTNRGRPARHASGRRRTRPLATSPRQLRPHPHEPRFGLG